MDGNFRSGRYAKSGHVLGMDLYKWGRLQGIQHSGAAGHCAGVPMLEQAAGIEHQRIFPVREFSGGGKFARNKSASFGRSRKAFVEENRPAVRRIRIETGPQFAVAPEAFISEALVIFGQTGEF